MLFDGMWHRVYSAIQQTTGRLALPDGMAAMYHSILTNLADKHAPCRTIRKKYRPLTPWFNDACVAQKRRARCFERVYRRTRLPEDRNAWLVQLRATQVQDVYWQTIVSESLGNARKLWNTLSSVMGKKQQSVVQTEFSAQEFLRSFAAKVSDVRSSTSGSAPPDFSEYAGIPLEEFAEISVEEVRRLIEKSPNKSCGLDPIPTWLLKEIAAEISPFITALFNRSILEGNFPLAFRTAEITPILKKNSLDSSIITNYRPISNLSYLSKLCERAIKVQLLDHLDGNNLLPEHQSAYRACHSNGIRATKDHVGCTHGG